MLNPNAQCDQHVAFGVIRLWERYTSPVVGLIPSQKRPERSLVPSSMWSCCKRHHLGWGPHWNWRSLPDGTFQHGQERRERLRKIDCIISYKVITEGLLHHFCHTILVRDKSQDIKPRDGNHWESESLSHEDKVLRELTRKGVQLKQEGEDWKQQKHTNYVNRRSILMCKTYCTILIIFSLYGNDF